MRVRTILERRRVLIAGGGFLGMALLPLRASATGELRIPTSAQTAGPYYPGSPRAGSNELESRFDIVLA